MRKIGLTVCYDTKNFGSQLQVLATKLKIEELGYNSEIIIYKKKLSIYFILQTLPRFFNIYFLRTKINKIKKKKNIKNNIYVKESLNVINKRFNWFMNEKLLDKSELYIGWKDLKDRANKKYDGFLCGSDQLWLPSNLGSHFYTLEFVNNKPKIAYATSFGVSNIPWFQRYTTASYLKKFNFLSSREKRGIEIIYELIKKHVPIVCDPTMLFSCDEWLKIIPNKRIIKEKYIFCYFLGKNVRHREYADELRKEKNIKIVSIPFLNNYVEYDERFADLNIFDVDSFDFVNLIRNAEYVLTDSFHGSVFSILNHKKFIVFDRFDNNSKNSRNSRIDSLCELLNLSERRFNGNIVNSIDKEIDYKKTDELLLKFRQDSITYLKDALQKSMESNND